MEVQRVVFRCKWLADDVSLKSKYSTQSKRDRLLLQFTATTIGSEVLNPHVILVLKLLINYSRDVLYL